jgi:hypothetical protein
LLSLIVLPIEFHRRERARKGGGGTTRTPGQTPDKESREQERTEQEREKQEEEEQERAVEEPHALQDRHQKRKEEEQEGRWRNHTHSRTDIRQGRKKEAKLEFLAPMWFRERHWLSTRPPCAPFPLFHEY